MTQIIMVGFDLVAVLLLVFGLYYPRYKRKDMVVAIIGLNIGILAVATAFSQSNVGAGLGLGLFGVLSIIRLRSAEIAQQEVAYYFISIAIGLLGGVVVQPDWVAPALMALILVVIYGSDHPRIFQDNRHQVVLLDQAYTDEAALEERLESLLGGRVQRMRVKRVDLVEDTTLVDVRFRSGRTRAESKVPSV